MGHEITRSHPAIRRLRRTIRTLGSILLVAVVAACAAKPTAQSFPDQVTGSADFNSPSRLVELSRCTLRERVVGQTDAASGPRFIMLNGVPVTSLIYAKLAHELSGAVAAQAVMTDFPGTGGSRMTDGHYSWENERACLREYLASQPPFYLVVHDIAGPVVLPLLSELTQLRGVIVFNTVLKPTALKPPFPLNVLRSGGMVARPMAYSAPYFFYAWRLRDLGIAREDAVEEVWLRQLYDELRADSGMGRLVDLMQGFDVDASSDDLIRRGLSAPVPQLFVWGELDPVLGGDLIYLPPLAAHQRLHTIPDAKHYLMMDYAKEISDVISQWLVTVAARRGT